MNLTALSRLAKKSPCHQRHVAIVVKGGAIIAYATNTIARHAEVRALKMAGARAAGATLFSLRLTPAGRIGNALPCQNCWHAIGKAGIAKTVWTRSETGWGSQAASWTMYLGR